MFSYCDNVVSLFQPTPASKFIQGYLGAVTQCSLLIIKWRLYLFFFTYANSMHVTNNKGFNGTTGLDKALHLLPSALRLKYISYDLSNIRLFLFSISPLRNLEYYNHLNQQRQGDKALRKSHCQT